MLEKVSSFLIVRGFYLQVKTFGLRFYNRNSNFIGKALFEASNQKVLNIMQYCLACHSAVRRNTLSARNVWIKKNLFFLLNVITTKQMICVVQVVPFCCPSLDRCDFVL